MLSISYEFSRFLLQRKRTQNYLAERQQNDGKKHIHVKEKLTSVSPSVLQRSECGRHLVMGLERDVHCQKPQPEAHPEQHHHRCAMNELQ